MSIPYLKPRIPTKTFGAVACTPKRSFGPCQSVRKICLGSYLMCRLLRCKIKIDLISKYQATPAQTMAKFTPTTWFCFYGVVYKPLASLKGLLVFLFLCVCVCVCFFNCFWGAFLSKSKTKKKKWLLVKIISSRICIKPTVIGGCLFSGVEKYQADLCRCFKASGKIA